MQQLEVWARRLQDIGLTEKQARVYISNVFLGPAPAQKIAEQAKVNRPTTYDILKELTGLGLASKTRKNGKTLFVAAATADLEELLARQAEEVERRRQALHALAPKLEEIERITSGIAPVVRFVNGKNGIDSIWSYAQRKAKPGTTIYAMTNHDETLKIYPEHLRTNPQIRLRKRLTSKQFYYNSKQEVPSDPGLLKETVRMDMPVAADITLYDDMAVLLSYGTDDSEWTGIVIESTEIVDGLRQLFEIAWNKKCRDRLTE